MTRDQATQLLPLIQAFVKGAQLQYLFPNTKKWVDMEEPLFIDKPENYRIKPKPLERWLATPTPFSLIQNPDIQEVVVKETPGDCNYWTFTLMREVEKP